MFPEMVSEMMPESQVEEVSPEVEKFVKPWLHKTITAGHPEDDYTIYGTVRGRGKTIKTFKAVGGGQLVDIKEHSDPADFRCASKEIQNLKYLRGPTAPVVAYRGSYFQGERLWLVTEQLEGISLQDIWRFPPTNQEMLCILHQTVKALAYIHSKDVMHRNITPRSILVTSSGVRLRDFELSTYAGEKRARGVGNVRYMAPELVTSRTYGKEVDMWAFGMSVLAAYTGRKPYAGKNRATIKKLIVENGCPEIGFQQPESFVALLRECLTVDPKLRATAEQLVEHPIFQNYDASSDDIIVDHYIERHRMPSQPRQVMGG